MEGKESQNNYSGVSMKNIDHYINTLFKSKSETNLAFELRLLDYIQQYKDGELTYINNELIKQQVQKVYCEEPNVNTYREEQIGAIFGVKKYDEQRLLLELIYYLVGEEHVKDEEEITLKRLDEWGDCVMQHGFYLGYLLNDEIIASLMKQLSIDYLLALSRDVDLRGEEWRRSCKEYFYEGLKDEEILERITIYNDGAYTSLPESVAIILYYIRLNQNYDQWLQLYDILTYVPLQGKMIYDIQTVEECLAIIEAETVYNVRHRKVFAHLLRSRIFDLLSQEQDLLERNNNNEELGDTKKEKASALLAEWNEKKQDYIRQIITTQWINIFSANNMIVWLGNQYHDVQNRSGIYKKKKREGLKLIEDISLSLFDFYNISIEDKDLLTLVYLISHVSITDKGKCDQVIRNICHKIYNEKHPRVSWRLNEDSLNEMRAVYVCLNRSENDGIELAKGFLNSDEGFGSSIEHSIRIHQGNKWWFSILMLKSEESEDVNEFVKYEDILLKCANRCDIMLHENYLLPFLIGECVAIDIIKNEKDNFERRLISEMEDIIFVVSVLTINQGILSKENKDILQRRINEEWEIAKDAMSFNRNIEACDNYIARNELR